VCVLLANAIGDEGVKRMDEALNQHTSLRLFDIEGSKQHITLDFGADTRRHHQKSQRNRTKGIRKPREDAQQASSLGGVDYFR